MHKETKLRRICEEEIFTRAFSRNVSKDCSVRKTTPSPHSQKVLGSFPWLVSPCPHRFNLILKTFPLTNLINAALLLVWCVFLVFTEVVQAESS